MSSSTVAADETQLVRFRSPQTVMSRFVARRTIRGAFLWALVFGSYVASKAIGFVDLYPTPAAREKVTASFSNNVGIEFILGRAPHTLSTAAYVAWNTAGIMVIIGSIWAIMAATKYFRGEEESGRWENLLSGQTTGVRAALNILVGLTASLGVLFIVLAILLTLVGRAHGVDYGSRAALFYALVVVLGVATYMFVGAVMSQLLSTRGRAAAASAIILAICFLLRGAGDMSSMHWLLDITPLGWIEKLQPLAHVQPLWLLPFVVLLAVLVSMTIIFARQRDLGDSIIADKTTAKPRLRLLGSPLGVSFRLTRTSTIGWLCGIMISAFLYGLITKATVSILGQSNNVKKAIGQLSQQSHTSIVLVFLGIVFLLQMLLIMFFAASGVNAIRREESEGYADNFLVRPISRLRWLYGRVFLAIAGIVLAGLLTTFSLWLSLRSQHLGIALGTLFSASMNALVPALLTAGVGLFAFSVRPRLTSILAYAVLVWSFLITMLSSGVHVSHWILDTSVLHQVALAPTANPDWHVNIVIILIALVLCGVGSLIFNARDLETE